MALAASALALAAPGAPAQTIGDDLIKWPQLLPPLPTSTEVQPGPVRNCRGAASVRCVNGLVRRLRAQWRRFDARCDHRAVISYSYLLITKGLRDDLSTRRPGLVRHRRWMTYLITTFSNRYFEAFRDHRHGRPVADAWRLTFEAAEAGDANAGQDVLLFSNAHVQHDLPFALEEMGLRARSGRLAQARSRRGQRDQRGCLRPDREVPRSALRPDLRPVRPADPGGGAGRARAGEALARGRVAQRRAPPERRDARRTARGRRADPSDLPALGAS